MTKYNLNNNGKHIGKGNINDKNIKKIFKKGIVTVGLTFGMGLAFLSCKQKGEIKVIDDSSIAQDYNGLKLNIEDGIIKPHDDVAPAYYMFDENNKLMESALEENNTKTINFVPSTHVYEFGYLLDENIDDKYQWCDYYYHQLMDAIQDNNNHVDPKIHAFSKKYDLLNLSYDEYTDFDTLKDYVEYYEKHKSIENTERLDILLDEFADELALWVGTSYDPKLIPQAEIERIKDLEELDGVGGPYYKITDYKVPNKTTLSELIKGYANNSKQYEDLFDKVIKDNNIENPDLIYEGQVLTLSGLDEQDLDEFGYRLPNEAELVDQYLAYFDFIEERGIQTLTGDKKGEQMKSEIIDGIKKFRQLANEPTEKDELALAKSIVEKIKVLTGYQMDIVARKR